MRHPPYEGINESLQATTVTDKSISHIPKHVAIIMDGNGRWATNRGKRRLEGHRAGTSNIRRVVEAFALHNINHLTLYAFSTENWGRPEDEVHGLIKILKEVIKKEARELHKNGIKVRHLGRIDRFSHELQQAIRNSIELTQNNTGMTLNVAFDYGGRTEILEAVRQIVSDGLSPRQITEKTLSEYLYTSGIPDPDLVIRTAGEMRLSNFLLWQSAYAEYYVTPLLWPDFDEHEVNKALLAYSKRQRRFGKVV